MKFDRLYANASNGKVKIWEIEADGNTMISRSGYLTGKMMTQSKKIKGKSLGRSNETSDNEQCILECKAKWQKKVDEQYTPNKNDIKEYSDQKILLPMLALDYHKRKHDIQFPCYIQPKLNGCLFRTSKIETELGIKTIEEIVENQLPIKVKTYNEKTNKIEWEKIINWMKKGKENYKNWLDIVPKNGKHLKVTREHKIFTNSGWKSAKNLDYKKDKILINSSEDRLNALIAGTILGDSGLTIDRRNSGESYRLKFRHTNKKYFDFKVNLLNLPGKIYNIVTGYGSRGWEFQSTALTSSTFPIKIFYNIGHHKKCACRKLVTYENLKNILTLESISLLIGDDGSLRFNNNNKNTPVLSLATQGFSKKQVIELQLFFKRKLFSTPAIVASKRKDNSLIGYGLIFNTKDTLYILNQLKELHCKGVEYKFYFKTGGYLRKVSDKQRFSNFKIRHSRIIPDSEKYDIEIENNHNFFANGILVHNCRCIYQNGKFMSRKGKEFTTLDHLIPELKKLGINIPDGEIYIKDATFQDIIRRVKKDRGTETDKLEYWIYDQINNDTFDKRNKDILTKHLHSIPKNVVYVPTILVKSEKEIKEYHDKWVKEGYEGAIIRNTKGLYKIKHRSKDLQKYKEFIDKEFKIVGGHEGTGSDEGTVVFEVKTKDGQVFSVIPKGTRETRTEWMNDIKKLINKDLTVRYQNLSEDGIPIFPVGIAIRDYE
jgi:DNA ligase-1